MFERFTDRARRVVVLAQEESKRLDHDYIGTEHLLLAMIHEGEGIAGTVLIEMGLGLDAARAAVEKQTGKGARPQPAGHIPFTARAKKSLELSLREALQLGHNFIGTEHILLGILRVNDGVAVTVLREGAGEPEAIRAMVMDKVRGLVPAPPPPAGTAAEAGAGAGTRGATAAAPAPAPAATAGPPPAPPLCPHCGLGLTGHIGVSRLVAAAGADLPSTRVLCVYCKTCGKSLGVLP